MTTHSVTAVIPAYHASAFVAEAIHSLQRQTLPPDQILVVDDGSTDDTAAVAEQAGARVIRQANAGPAAARNAGIRAAATEWIALLDADDLARPERLAAQQRHLSDPRVAVVFAAHHLEGRTVPTPPAEITFDVLWARNWIPTSTVLLRRSAWEAVGGFDEERALIGVEDYNLWLRLAHAGWGFAREDQVLVDYCPTPASLTAQTLRFANAELTNVARLARRLGLSAEAVRTKEHAIYLEYGLELFHGRQLPAARRFLGEASKRGAIGAAGHLRWIASFLPLSPRVPA